MPNSWVEHVKSYASKHKLSYACAISKPDCKASYHKKQNKGMKKLKKEQRELPPSKMTKQQRMQQMDKILSPYM